MSSRVMRSIVGNTVAGASTNACDAVSAHAAGTDAIAKRIDNSFVFIVKGDVVLQGYLFPFRRDFFLKISKAS